MDPPEEPDTPSTSGEGLVRVPKAVFIEDVAAFLAGHPLNAFQHRL
jgi:hypothetical protein